MKFEKTIVSKYNGITKEIMQKMIDFKRFSLLRL